MPKSPRPAQIDTIVAQATAVGRAGIAVVRLSGPHAFELATKLSSKKKLEPGRIQFSRFYTADGALIDQGLLLVFKSPQSFTGEDVVEFQIHAAPVIVDKLIRVCVSHGARLARPGEFSERAFLNDKLDLAQAEAIADLIAANSETAASMALQTLEGAFSKEIQALVERLILLRLYVEAAMDFPEEEIDFLSDGKIALQLDTTIHDLEQIRKTASQGAILREGLHLVIAGLPNAGKSTLINALAGKDLAIVTPIAGTTRDVMREQILLDDIPLHIIDTAGLRDSEDPVEQEGIRRAWNELRKADCIILLRDIQEDPSNSQHLLEKIRSETAGTKPAILQVLNKVDQITAEYTDTEMLCISAQKGIGLEHLKAKIKALVGYQPEEGRYMARRRHLEAIETALNLLKEGKQQLGIHRAAELLAEDLRLAQENLSEITGEFSSDDLLGRIFSSFCIGK